MGSIDWLPSPEVDAEYDGYAKFYDSIDALVQHGVNAFTIKLPIPYLYKST